MATMTMLLQRQCNMRRTHALCVMSCALRSRPCICSGFSTLNTAQNESLSELSTSSNWKYWKSLKIFLCLHLLLLPDRLHDLPPDIDQLLIMCEIYMIFMCVCTYFVLFLYLWLLAIFFNCQQSNSKNSHQAGEQLLWPLMKTFVAASELVWCVRAND